MEGVIGEKNFTETRSILHGQPKHADQEEVTRSVSIFLVCVGRNKMNLSQVYGMFVLWQNRGRK